ncbi:amidohydrolase family protein [candidate division KSB1 bacterium]
MKRKYKRLAVNILAIIIYFTITPSSVTGQADYLKSIKKIDIHTHISDDAVYLREVMDKLNLKLFTICNKGKEGETERMHYQVNFAKEFCSKYPRYYAWCTTFDLSCRNEPDWASQVKSFLKDSFSNGAVAVKIWKEIGMQIKNPAGEFIQVDDPIFEPIYDFIEQERKVLFYHIADPVQRWMPSASIKHSPKFADFWNDPDKPSYFDIIASGDNMLAKHPNLRFIGCHLGSISFDLDETSKKLDTYPNLALGTSGTEKYLIGQSREKVRRFFIKYQDRILYGTDISGGMIPTDYLLDLKKLGQKLTPEQAAKRKEFLMKRYINDFRYFGTDEVITKGNHSVSGLALPKEVLYKIFYGNAVKWVPGINKDY